MVSFQCESCGDVFTKKKLDAHTNRCWNTSFTCLDCHTQFWNGSYKSHTSCISEDQKYQGALYKDKKAKRQPQHTPGQQEKIIEYSTGPAPSISDFAVPSSPERRPPKVRFEEPEPPPPAPSPPAAAPAINVFDYLEPDSDGESASSVSSSDLSESGSDRSPSPEVGRGAHLLKNQQQPPRPASASSTSTQQQQPPQGYYPPPYAYNQQYPPPYGYAPNGQAQPQPPHPQSNYWAYPPPQQPFATPGHPSQAPPNPHSASHSPLPPHPPTITRDASAVIDSQRSISGSKRKRSPSIAAGPPTRTAEDPRREDARKRELHSGLTGGLNKLLAAPEDSRARRGSEERSPLSPKKRQKSSDTSALVKVRGREDRDGKDRDEDRKRRKETRRKLSDETVSTALTTTTRSTSGRSRRRDGGDGAKSRKALTYPPQQRHGEARSDFFLGLIDKGAESVKGQSLWGVLKMFHEGRAQGDDRETEEKRLLKGLRCRINRHGEVVLFARGESERE